MSSCNLERCSSRYASNWQRVARDLGLGVSATSVEIGMVVPLDSSLLLSYSDNRRPALRTGGARFKRGIRGRTDDE